MIDNTGQQILAYRVRHQITQRDFAKRIGVAPTTVSHWERGTAEPRGSAAILVDLVLRGRIELQYDERS